MNIRFLGIEVERKTSILALAAFLLSLSSIGYQIFSFLKGPEVTLAKSRQVIIYMYPAADTSERFLTLVTTLAYVNNGQPGNNAVVMEERVSFALDGKEYKYNWHEFVSITLLPRAGTPDTRGERGIDLGQTRTSSPFVVAAGGAEAHETWFAPRFDDQFVGREAVVRALESALKGGHLLWKFQFYAETLNDGTKTADCEITISARLAQQILSQELGWAALNCNQPPQGNLPGSLR